MKVLLLHVMVILLIMFHEGVGSETDRMIAFVGNWQPCPTSEQTASYTELMIAFAVTYRWSPNKNICNTQCVIGSPVPICNNQPNAPLVSKWQSEGKKVILSFGGAAMGGSWASSNDDCWEHCFGKEDFVVDQLVNIVSVQGFDGVDIDYEYYYENGQKGSSFSRGAEAQRFLREVTKKLRSRLPSNKIVSHAPMDSDMVKGTGYYNVIKSVAGDLDFLMPQYYNGVVRPHSAFTASDRTALNHFNNLVNDVFSGDSTKVTFGFCISDCPGYNTQSSTAVQVVRRMKTHFPCNGGVFFWVATHDSQGRWSRAVSAELGSSCGNPPPTPSTPSPRPTPPPRTSPPRTPQPARPPTPTPPSGGRCKLWDSCGATPNCCPSGITCYRQSKYYSQCLKSCPTGWECNSQNPTPPPPGPTPKPQTPGRRVGINLCSHRIGKWGGCTAAPYCCADGLTCFEQSEWYAQCGTTCTSGTCRDLSQLKDVTELGQLGQKAPVCQSCQPWQNDNAYCTGSGSCKNIPQSGTCLAGETKCFKSSSAASSARKVITFVLQNGVGAFDRSKFESLVRSSLRDQTAKVLLKYLCPASVCPRGHCADPFGEASQCFGLFDISSERITILDGDNDGSVVGFEIKGSDEGLVDAYNNNQLTDVVTMHQEWQPEGYETVGTNTTQNKSFLTIIITVAAAFLSCVLMVVGALYFKKRTHQQQESTAVVPIKIIEAVASEEILNKTTTGNEADYEFQI